MDSNLDTGSELGRNAASAGRRPCAARWRVLITAAWVAACGVETEPGPGKQDASVVGDAGSGGSEDSGSAGQGDAGDAPDAGSGGTGAGAGSGAGSGGAGSGAGAGSGGDSGGGADCDETRSPADEPCLVTDDHAVFVATRGDDDDEGTMAKPLRTVGAALIRAAESGIARVIVCGGTYEEALVIDAAVAVHGGFACDETPWRHTGAATLVAPAQLGHALRIEDVDGRVLIENVQFAARHATGAGVSSIAALVKDSEDVVLRRVELQAGAGSAGAAGVTQGFTFPKTGAPGDTCGDPMMMCLAGKPADGDSGGGNRVYECPGGDTTIGGLGGDESVGGAEPGDPGLPDYGTGDGGGGPGGASCTSGENGASGEAGPAGAGAQGLGALDEQTWIPASGEPGMPGLVGQGGGGGGARTGSGGGGGGGGGGCGGAGGGAGQGGGGSIALVSVRSGVTLEGCALRAGAGGDGGRGVGGQDGMSSGGIGGAGACTGGAGGGGGKGGPGGGGAGGISAGIVWSGDEPNVESTQFVLGTPGNGGPGGDDASTDDDGIDGMALEIAPF